jgi:hypothetical protein
MELTMKLRQEQIQEICVVVKFIQIPYLVYVK